MSTKIVYEDIAVGADVAVTVASSSVDPKSNVALLPFGTEHPDLATLELNKWILDGAKAIYDGQDIAFISTAMSGPDCLFSVTPAIVINFSSNYTTLGITFRFSTNSVDYPTSLTLAWYRGATLLDTKNFTPNDVSYFCENTVTAFNKVVITINATNLPYRYARIEHIIFGVVREFGIRELDGVTVLQETNLLSAEISIDTLEWKLKSKSGVNYLFQLKQPVLAYKNSRLIGAFYVDDGVKRSAENIYTIPCCDALGVLDGDTFDAVMYSNKNAVTALTEIVNGDFELEIDSSFESKTLTGLNPDGTRRTAIQHIAFAIGAVVSTAGTRKIRIFPAPAASAAAISVKKLFSGGSIEQSAIVTAVVVTYHTYTPGSGAQGDEVITVGGVKYVHTTGAVRVDNPAVTASDKPNVKLIKDATLVNAANANEVAARVYAYYQRRNAVSNKIVISDEEPGDYVTIPTAWNAGETGNIESMKLKLSNTVAADIKIRTVS